MTILNKITKVIANFLGGLAAIMTAGMVAILTWQVICRYILKNSSGWTSELTMILFVWSSMLGAAWAVKAGGHVAMTMLINKFKGRFKAAVQLVAMLVCEIFFYVVFRGGLTMTLKLSRASTPQLGIPMSYVYSAYVIGGACMLIFGLEWIITYLRDLIKSPVNEAEGGAN